MKLYFKEYCRVNATPSVSLHCGTMNLDSFNDCKCIPNIIVLIQIVFMHLAEPFISNQDFIFIVKC